MALESYWIISLVARCKIDQADFYSLLSSRIGD